MAFHKEAGLAELLDPKERNWLFRGYLQNFS